MNKSIQPISVKLLCFAASATFLGNAGAAVTINWGNSPANPTVNFDSAGVALTDARFAFELGAFDLGAPMGLESTWRSQWTVYDTPPSGYNESLQTFQSTWVTSDSSLTGSQLSIWIHNNDFSATETSEWSIFSADDWIIPEMGDQRLTPLEFRITTEDQNDELFPADILLFGGLFDMEGPGVFSADPDGSVIQTATFIPEPSSVLLAALGGAVFFTRRRK